MNSKVLGIVIIIVSLLGLIGSIASLFLHPNSQGIAFYILNTIGDITVLAGGLMLVRKRPIAKALVYIGSIIFGVAGIISMFYSFIGGIVTVLVAILFITLTKYCLDNKKSSSL